MLWMNCAARRPWLGEGNGRHPGGRMLALMTVLPFLVLSVIAPAEDIIPDTNTPASTVAVAGAKNVTDDSVRPDCVITGPVTQPATLPITVTFTFSEEVTGFTKDDVTLGGCAGGALATVSATVYTMDLMPTGTGTMTCQVPAGLVFDLANNGNTASNQYSLACVLTNPVPIVTTEREVALNTLPIIFTITFNEPVTGLTAAGITVTGGVKGALSGSGAVYTLPVSGVISQARVTCQVLANAASSVSAALPNTASMVRSVNYDPVAPTCIVSASAGVSTDTSPIVFTAVFSEVVTGLTADDFIVTNGFAGTLAGGGLRYTLAVTPNAVGAVTCALPGSVAVDAALNGNLSSNTASINYTNPNPACWVTGPASPTASNPLVFAINFGAPVVGLTMSEVFVASGVKQTLTGNGAAYTLNVTTVPGVQTTVTCQVPAGVAQGADGTNLVSNMASVVYDQMAPTAVIAPVATPTTADAVMFTVTFSEAVGTTFTADDVLVNLGTLTGTASVSGVDPVYTVKVQLVGPNTDGTVGITIPANAVTDLVGFKYRGGTSPLCTVYKPVPTGTIVINNNRSATNSAGVTLALTWDDGGSGSDVSRMRFSDNGSTWTAWEPLAATRPYVLPGTDSHKTVRVQFLDKANNRSAVYSDYILLDTTAPTGSIVINNGASVTTSLTIMLGLTWMDAGAGVARMRFSDDGAHWTAWMPQKATCVHTLPAGPGYHTVRVQYLDGAGNYSAVFTDYIKLQMP